ncbi:PREDICTED: protein SHQ1 homolog isoform X2 [Wasmannia auropunctata]|uniref:protein SHQ1 homolog isoform X2 n=1 Tax=Wasmannia auropunctata TaxID=64793 RepID=UPI0005EE4C80|nr:PREDICTED: protein SHQ1 homolog isoform X2 [Wasmannia auropunctata]
MLTPRFELTQNDEEVTMIIHAPYANIKDAEVSVDGTDFLFSSTPYFLRLQLPGKIEENDLSSGSYDCDKGDFTFRFSKVNKGEHFENLEMITSLMAPPKNKSVLVIPNIEVIGNPSVTKADINETNDIGDFANNLPKDDSGENMPKLLNGPKYGFANRVSGALLAFEAAWLKEIIDLPNPDVTPEPERKALREQRESKDFSDEHYVADLMELRFTGPPLEFEAEWETLQKDQIAFSEAEVDLLKELPNKEYLLNNEDQKQLCFNLIDILYASCFNYRTTFGENNVESAWNINKLSSTLCWFQSFTSLEEVIRACIRRALCYPLYRHWEISVKVFEDVKGVLSLGKKYIIKRFCEIHSLFNTSHEPRYILNQLYIKDFLIWLQTLPECVIESLCSALNDIHPTKASMGFDLEELEVAARTIQEEDLIIENSIHNMAKKLEAMSANQSDSTQETLSSSSSSTDSSDTDSDTSSSSSSSSSSSTSLDSDDLNEPNEYNE